MFFPNYMTLCARKGVFPTKVAEACGFTAASYTGWSRGAIPRRSSLQKIADYFGVTVDELLGELPDRFTSSAENQTSEISQEESVNQTNENATTGLPGSGLTRKEIELIKLFRASSEEARLAAYAAAVDILISSL